MMLIHWEKFRRSTLRPLTHRSRIRRPWVSSGGPCCGVEGWFSPVGVPGEVAPFPARLSLTRMLLTVMLVPAAASQLAGRAADSRSRPCWCRRSARSLRSSPNRCKPAPSSRRSAAVSGRSQTLHAPPGYRGDPATAVAGNPCGQAGDRGGTSRVHAAVEGPSLSGRGSLPPLLAEAPGAGDGGDRAGTARLSRSAEPGENGRLLPSSTSGEAVQDVPALVRDAWIFVGGGGPAQKVLPV